MNSRECAMRQGHLFDMVHHTPGEAPCRSAFTDPAHLAALGFSGQVVSAPVSAAVTWEDFDNRVFPAGSPERQWVEAKAAALSATFKAAKAAGISCLAMGDWIVLPRTLVTLRAPDLARVKARDFAYEVKGEFTPDIHDPRIQEMVRYLVDAIFGRFPELDGLVVRVGETYLHDLPHHTGGDPLSRGVESHVTMLRLLREAVCVKHGRKLLYRTWLSGIDEDAAMYESVTGQVEPHPDLIFSIKHCVNDFHRTHLFSPPLGLGRHQQIVEVQCAREYEGKGAYPNFIAGGVIDGFEEDANIPQKNVLKSLRELARQDIFAGVWMWSRGGGWGGPYIPDEFWCALNAEVLAGWTRDPARDVGGLIAEDARARGFDGDDAKRLEAICLKSAAAVVRGIASVKGGVNTWWTRDLYLGGVEDPAGPMAETVAAIVASGRTEEILAEREDSIRLWREIEALAGEMTSGPEATRAFIRTSCGYGRRLFEVIEAGWTLMLLDRQSVREAARMHGALARYDQAWSDYRQLAADNKNCPTLYRDVYCRYVRDKGMIDQPGMGASVERIRRELTSL